MSTLLAHIVGFGRELRAAGVEATSSQLAHFVQAIAAVGIGDREAVRDAGRATLAGSRDELAAFDAVFDRWWSAVRGTPSPPPAPAPIPPPRLLPAEAAIARRLGRDQPRDTQALADRTMTWSAIERLRRKHFDRLTPDEETTLRRLFLREAWPIVERRTRRFRRAPSGEDIDWRGMIRAAIRHGGELVVQRWRRRRVRPRPLVVLADVSGSMERFSRMLLLFLHALAHEGRWHARARPLEVFVFGTRLTRITRPLRLRHPDAALDAVSAAAADWSGGTRIGDALRAFNTGWGRRALRRRPTVLIVSDGWDRGDPDRIGREMERLRRLSHRILWLHPLAGTPGFSPQTRALVAAMPFVDELLPAGSLAELAAVGRNLD